MEAESPCAASDLAVARRELLSGNHRELDPVGLRQTWLDLHESWLIDKADEIGIADASGFAIVGVGGLGRRELLPYSDLDVLLLHDGKPADILRPVADRLWYPLWDANIRLDHSVRTVSEALTIANSDLMAALGMLEARHIAGDQQLSFALIDGVRRQWRNGIRSRMGELVEMTYARWRRCGRIAQRAEPDLKLGRGGLRDVQLLDALALAQLIDRHGIGHTDLPAGSLDGAYRTLLDVRTELHRVSGRGRDHLLAQFADEISAALGFGDRFDLARTLSSAGRTIGYHAEAGLRTAANALPRRGISALVRRPKRRPLDEGVVEYAGEIVLARDAEPEHDPGLVLRVAAASANTGLPIGAATLSRLAASVPDLPTPWPQEALDDLLVVLSAGPTTVATIEALDRTGLWGRLLPEWEPIRDLPPRDVAHKWTVDRHVVETAVHAAPLATRVARPDLLALGALLHDIGKGRGTDHSVLGAELVIPVCTRLGLSPPDVRTLSKLVRHHLLLPITATRRDLNDPKTIEAVSEALGGDPQLLEVLHALSEADSKATGPGVWSDWKASLVDDLVRRCRMVMAGESLPQAEPTAPHYLSLAADHGVHVEISPRDGERIDAVIVAPDERGLVSKAAAVLALNSLRVHSASVNVHQGVAITEFVVSPLFWVPARGGVGASAVCRCPQRRRRRAGHAAEAGQRCRQLGIRSGRGRAGRGARDSYGRSAPHPVARHRRAGQADPRSSGHGSGGFARVAGRGAGGRGSRHCLGEGQYVRIDRGRCVLCDGPRGVGRESRGRATPAGGVGRQRRRCGRRTRRRLGSHAHDRSELSCRNASMRALI